jgi:Papain-like cysteine protease AvrRpt2
MLFAPSVKWNDPVQPDFSGLTSRLVPLLPEALVLAGSRQGYRRILRAGIALERIRHFNARQALPHWCWAADVQMILAYYGIHARQDEIVARLFGAPIDIPGSPQAILAALSARAFADGCSLLVESTARVDNPHELLDDLINDRPLLVGLQREQGTGHAYVLSAVTYSVNFWGAPVFHTVILHDPWPFTRDMEEMSWCEFRRTCSLMVRVRVRRH